MLVYRTGLPVPETSRTGVLQSVVALVQVRGFRDPIASTMSFCTRTEAVTFVTVEPACTLVIR